jgi:hypothetical protein
MSKKNKIAMGLRKQKPFACISPSGIAVKAVNLRQFCIKNNLNSGAMWSVIHGKIPHHKGWKMFNQ